MQGQCTAHVCAVALWVWEGCLPECGRAALARHHRYRQPPRVPHRVQILAVHQRSVRRWVYCSRGGIPHMRPMMVSTAACGAGQVEMGSGMSGHGQRFNRRRETLGLLGHSTGLIVCAEAVEWSQRPPMAFRPWHRGVLWSSEEALSMHTCATQPVSVVCGSSEQSLKRRCRRHPQMMRQCLHTANAATAASRGM